MLGAAAGSLVTYANYGRILDKSRTRDSMTASDDTAPYYSMKALIVAHDAEMVSIFTHLFHETRVKTQECASESEAIDRLSSEKFEALVLDIDQVAGCARIAGALQRTRPNQNVVVFAVATDSQAKETASALSSPFVIDRPFALSKIRGLVRTVHGRMLRDRLAYFRLAIELPVSIRKKSGGLLECTTFNLSQNGMAVSTTSSFDKGEQLTIVFALPNSEVVVSGDGTVIWDDRHGQAGIRFRCTSSRVQEHLSEWLHDQFFMRVGTGSAEGQAPAPKIAG